MITVVNLKGGRPRGVVRVHRPTPLGNPFHIGQDGTREQVINKYDQWLAVKLSNAGSLQSREMRSLLRKYKQDGKLILGCWCAPLDCHADVIARVLRARLAAQGGL
tara:strand:+ start:291 stop:608 length:318 start_codon:yes stop_codon:yes gene_type:complete